MVRTCLFEAAGMLLTRVQAWSSLKAWDVRLAKTASFRKTKIAVARKLAIILHRVWRDKTTFRPGQGQAATSENHRDTEFRFGGNDVPAGRFGEGEYR
jgi:hypothetical protein